MKIPHLATPLGVRQEPAFHSAYWKAFDRFFGSGNSQVVKAMLLAKIVHGDTGDTELDRVCFGLRQTMAWLADAIEKAALTDIGIRPLETRTARGDESAAQTAAKRATT